MLFYQKPKISRKVFYAGLVLFLIIICLGFYFLSSTKPAKASNPLLSAVITPPSRISGMAPLAILFKGYNSTPREQEGTYGNAGNIVRYFWDFGAGTESDVGGRYFVGFNAAHVFEKSGTYTVVLTVTDTNGNQASNSVNITVNSFGGNTYYVDSIIGNDYYYNGKSSTADGTPNILNDSVTNSTTTAYRFNDFIITDINGTEIGYLKDTNLLNNTIDVNVYQQNNGQEILIGKLSSAPTIYQYGGANLNNEATSTTALTMVATSSSSIILASNLTLTASHPTTIESTVTNASVTNCILINSTIINSQLNNVIVVNSKVVSTNKTNGTISVDTYGNFNNNIPGPWKTAEKAFYEATLEAPWPNKPGVVRPGDQILFNRGQTFNVSKTLELNPNTVGPINFDAYGSGDRPKLVYSGINNGDTVIIDAFRLVNDIRFINLDISSPQATAVTGFWASDRILDILFLHNNIHDTGTIFGYSSSGCDRFFAFDNQTDNSTGGMYFADSLHMSLALVKNTFMRSTSHAAYIVGIQDSVITDNFYGKWAFGRSFRITGPDVKNIVVRRNTFEGWLDPILSGSCPTCREAHDGGTRYNWALIHFGPNNNVNYYSNYIDFSDNILTNFEMGVLLGGGQHNMLISNNLFITPSNYNTSDDVGQIAFYPHVGNYASGNADIRIFNNTFVSNSTEPTLSITNYNSASGISPVNHKNISFKNNIVTNLSTNAGPAIRVDDTQGLLSELDSNNNLYYFPNRVGGPYFRVKSSVGTVNYNLTAWSSITGKRTLKDTQSLSGDPKFNSAIVWNDDALETQGESLRLNNDSPAIDWGANVSIFSDFSGSSRPQGLTFDIGAYESTYTNPSPAPACQENWNCTAWSACVNNNQTKTCTDANSCGTVVNKPAVSQACSATCSPNWNCTTWNTCSASNQTRTCTDNNNCGITTGKPAVSQTCSSAPGAPGSQSPSACQENWNCTNWTTCTNNNQTKSCTDLNHCGTVVSKPSITQACSATCSPNWQCIPWNTCTASKQTRTCTDSNKCNLTLGKPTTSQTCVMPASQITPTKVTSFLPGRLIKLATSPNVYYLSASSTRHLFTNMTSLNSWLANQKIETISAQTMNTYKLSNNATLRPGTKLVRFATNPKIYMVTPGAKLCQLGSPSAVSRLYGTNWPKKVVNLPTNDFKDYAVDTTCYLGANSLYPDGTVLTYQGSPAVWYIENQKKRYVGPWAFKANNFSYDFVLKNVPTSFVYPSGNRL